MSRAWFPVLLLLIVSFPATLALSQSSSKAPVSYRLTAIAVKGLSHLKPEQIIAASGLKVGEFQKQADFEAAIEKLGKTGLFTQVSYNYQCAGSACSLQFEVSENEQLVPIAFDNLVWFSDDELLAMLASKLPLFSGRLPISGNLAEEVSGTLQAFFNQRKISGDISCVHATSSNGQLDSYVYKIERHPVLIRDFSFPGAASSELDRLENASKPLAGHEYLRSKTGPEAVTRLLPVYLALGYLQAKFSTPAATVVEDGPQTWVHLQFPVTPGNPYKLTNLEWTGNTVLPVSKLEELIHLKIGEPVDAIELGRELEEIEKLYGTKGYLFARVYPSSTLNDAEHTVSYELNVSEGDLYRMGDLLLDGLDGEAARKMAAQWQMKKGTPYDNTYLGTFFKLIYRDIGLQVPYEVVPKQSVNSQDKTVSVVLHFVPKT